MNFFRNFKLNYHDWFIVYKLPAIKDEKAGNILKKELINKFKKFFLWRMRKIEYFEPYTNKYGHSYIILGSAKGGTKMNRNVVIFLLELYAHLNNTNIKVTEDFPLSLRRFKTDEVEIYKVLKNKHIPVK